VNHHAGSIRKVDVSWEHRAAKNDVDRACVGSTTTRPAAIYGAHHDVEKSVAVDIAARNFRAQKLFDVTTENPNISLR
jgi:hypothetical protein